MVSDLLPESVNLILDGVEASLCFPILVIMVLCTVQLIINHFLDIGCTVYQVVQDQVQESKVTEFFRTGGGIAYKIKDMLSKFGIGKKAADLKMNSTTLTNSQEEEWDYCEDDI